MLTSKSWVFFAGLLALGCSSNSTSTPRDGGGEFSSAVEQGATLERGTRADRGGRAFDASALDASALDGSALNGSADGVGPEGGADRGAPVGDARTARGDAALPETCSGACATQTLGATFGAQTARIARAAYGIDRDGSGRPGIYIEALHGAPTGCPTDGSPTPDRTLVISGLPLPRLGAPLSEADGVVVSLLDFKGDLLGTALVAKATAIELSFVAASVCTGCVGKAAPADPDGFVAIDLKATFDGGTIEGRVYAPHCDVFDL